MFPIEEYANGKKWMDDGSTGARTPSEAAESVNGDESRNSTRPATPAGQIMNTAHVSSAYTPRSHPEALQQDFFVGSC